jgi:hypothetical protein
MRNLQPNGIMAIATTTTSLVINHDLASKCIEYWKPQRDSATSDNYLVMSCWGRKSHKWYGIVPQNKVVVARNNQVHCYHVV